MISESGKFYKIVEEKNVAWHCGKSSWKKYEGLNNFSLGIELDNPGHGVNYKSFSKRQMDSLVLLLQKILLKYNINYKNVLAHSDIAPERKLDPGELFNWSYLAKKKIAFFPSSKLEIFLPLSASTAFIRPTVKQELEPIPLLAGKSPS